jgi:hypothetical protein
MLKNKPPMDKTTFGNRPCDHALTSFLNSLRESPQKAKKIRRQVLALMHRLNLATKTLFGVFFQYPISSSNYPNHPAAWIPPQKFQRYLFGLVEKEFTDQVGKKPWRSPLKTLTHTCIKERFRELHTRLSENEIAQEDDPIEEIRKVRQTISQEFSNDLDKLVKFYQGKQS